MATTLITRRPSALAGACPQLPAGTAGRFAPQARHAGVLPVLSEVPFTMTQAYGLGQPAEATTVRTAPAFGSAIQAAISTKINNYIGAVPAAALNGANPVMAATTSILAQLPSAIALTQHAGVDKVKGGDARGIPPRGIRTV
jgi:hypothetical protein